MVEHVFDKDENILHMKVSGDKEFSYYLNGIKRLYANPQLPKNLAILQDARELRIQLNHKNIHHVHERLNSVSSRFTKIRHALVIEDPMHTALAFLLKELLKDQHYAFNVFSTKEAAYKWLKDDPGF
jgi:hypothetical protein